MKTISLLGSGWLGLALAKYFRLKNFQVKASTRSAHRISELQALGVQPYLIDIDLIDITDLSQDVQGFLDSDILIINITSKNMTGYAEFIRSIKASSIEKLLFVSSSSVYQNSNQLVLESEGMEDTNSTLYKIEKLFQNSAHFHTTVVRMAGLIGPGRHPGGFFKGDKPVQQPDAPVNLIHQADCVNIIGQIVEQDVWGEVFNASADTHPTKREFYSQAKKSLGQQPPRFAEPESLSYKVVGNQKVKRVLNYELVHADLMALVTQSEGAAFDL